MAGRLASENRRGILEAVVRVLEGSFLLGPSLKERAVSEGVNKMRYIKYVGLVALLMVVAAGTASAQVRVGIGIGPAYVGVGPAPACVYGYYPYAPYACAPYGYYGP